MFRRVGLSPRGLFQDVQPAGTMSFDEDITLFSGVFEAEEHAVAAWQLDRRQRRLFRRSAHGQTHIAGPREWRHVPGRLPMRLGAS